MEGGKDTVGSVYAKGGSLVFVPSDNDQATAVAFEHKC